MSVSRAAKLVLTLVDQVTGPAKGIQAALNGVTRAVQGVGTMALAPARVMTATSRSLRRNASDMTVASGALALGLGKAGKDIYQMEDVLNEIEGRRFGKRDIFNLADGTEMSREAFRKSVIDLVTTIDKESPRNAGEIAKAYNQLVQAGLTHEQVHAILPISVDFAIAGNYDTEEAADKLTNVITSMQMPQATFQDAQNSAQRAADVIAYAANITNSNVQQMTEAFKYAAPSAAALGVSIEQLAAMFVIQAKRGIKASEAGVSIRAMFTRMVRPTKMAAAALAQYGIDLADYLERNKEISASDVTTVLSTGGLDASKATAEIDRILSQGISTAEKVKRITAEVQKAVGDSSTMSAETISDAVREVLYSFGESLDVERLIEDMQKANIAVSDFFKIFDVRQGARTLSLFSDDLGKWVDQIVEHAGGFTEAMSDVRMKGIVGAIHRLDSSLFSLFRTIADSGVLDSFTKFFEGLEESVRNLAEVNPQLLEMGTYAVIAVAGLAPLGFALTGLAAAAAIVVNPLSWVIAGLGYLAYLNFDNIVTYVRNFGTAVVENLGPRTQNAIEKVKELMTGLMQTHEFDAAGAGQQHGSGFAQFIENEIAGLEHMVEQWSGLGSRMAGAWTSFESWWDGLIQSTHTKAAEWSAAFKNGITWLFDGSADAWLRESLSSMAAASMEGLSAAFDAFVNSQFATTFAKAGSVLYEAGASMIQSLWDGAVSKFTAFIEWVKGIPGRIRAAIGSINLSDVINFGGWFGGGGSGPGSGPGPANDNYGGERAGGGPIKAGLTYLVGEEGPELLTSNRDGNIVPNHKLGGGTTIAPVFNNHFHLHGGASRKDAEDLARALDRQLSRSAQVAVGILRPYGDE